MNPSFLLSLLLPLLGVAPLPVQGEEAPAEKAKSGADSHADLADALANLLQHTAATLEQCMDDASVAAAIPQLKAQREEAARLIVRQAAMPEPTVQDYMAAQARANDFLEAKRTIQTHIERLQTEGLLTDEIRRILGIAPETPASGK